MISLTKQTRIIKQFTVIDMQFWLNEKSLNQQFNSIQEFKEAIIAMNAIFSFIEEKRKNDVFFKDNLLFKADYKAIKDEYFQFSFNKINPQLQYDFKKYLNEGIKAKDWRLEKQHNENDKFYCKISKQDVCNTTLAEVAERNLKAEIDNVIVNFANSFYKNCKEIDIFKNDEKYENPIKISCIEQAKDFNNFVIKQDNSTIYHNYLENSGLFEKTNLCYTGTGVRIFRKKSDSSYWYFDFNHNENGKPHFEVFNRTKTYEGSAYLLNDTEYEIEPPKKGQTGRFFKTKIC